MACHLLKSDLEHVAAHSSHKRTLLGAAMCGYPLWSEPSTAKVAKEAAANPQTSTTCDGAGKHQHKKQGTSAMRFFFFFSLEYV